jgi:hypothetical protein
MPFKNPFLLAIAVMAGVCGACSSDSSNQSSTGDSATNAGTGGGGGGGGTGTAPDPCALLTIGEIQPIIDSPLMPGQPGIGGLMSENRFCDWNAEDLGSLSITAFGSVNSYESARRTLPALAGVGDEAFVSLMVTIYVKVNQKAFFAQSTEEVKGGVVSAEVKAALGDAGAMDLARYEAAYRLAKVFVTKL